MALSAYSNLRAICRSPRSTGQQLGDALRDYFSSNIRPRKPLGDGDFLVIDTKGQCNMMTREDYGKLLYRKPKRVRKRKKDGEQLVAFDTIEAGRIEVPVRQEMQILMDEDLAYIDKIVREDRENQYHGEF
jgi:hypothetical protein